MNDVREYYNSHMEEEDRRLDEHPFEVPITMHFVREYMKPGNHLFDVACGTGRIATILLNMGYNVGLNDLSDKNIGLVKKRLHSNDNILFINRADVLECEKWSERKWDGILILGPLYQSKHLLSVACKPK